MKQETVEREIVLNDVVVFMNGHPDAPGCAFSAQMVRILDLLRVQYRAIDVPPSPELGCGTESQQGGPAIPRLYVKGKLVGGYDAVREMFRAGELQAMFAENGVSAFADREFW
ncbi:glutaredoxin domain-containing protein [Tardiphaga sp. 42S5]|uniref:glutaredoxin domain-containing protein n=1 Tax=Tardiphaga sp. 42S5 TaxID=1404799 RepID=UPI002A598373|nr:glutaredoxin domain-containing protein [Tardiphaga sp. 42S5]WPO43986.1 glutaredoxin domain-containing protein [Tardiphaga sp. 42S5]